MKKVLSVMLSLSLVLSMAVLCGAAEHSHTIGSEDITIIDGTGLQPNAVGGCTHGSGICQAYANGAYTTVTLNGVFQFTGYGWHCKNCWTYYATEYHPRYDGKIGRYAMWPRYGQVNIVVYMNVDSIFTASGTQIEGVSLIG